MIKFGFSTIGCPSYTVDQVIELAQENAFSGVEIRFIRNEVDLTKLEEFSPSHIAETRRRFDDGGIEVVCIDTSVRLTSLDAAERRAQRDLAQINCDIAEGLGAKYLRVFGGPIPTSQDREESIKGIAEGLSVVAEETYARGVMSLLETHDDFCTSASVMDLFSHGVSDHLGVLWDTLHSFRHGETPDQTYAALGERIKHVHVKDSTVATPEGFDFALTGAGIVPIPGIIETLKRAGYDGYVDFEWEKAWHPEIAEPEIAIPHFARYLAGVV
jgi:sugar phosphate isomerase/epimerase